MKPFSFQRVICSNSNWWKVKCGRQNAVFWSAWCCILIGIMSFFDRQNTFFWSACGTYLQISCQKFLLLNTTLNIQLHWLVWSYANSVQATLQHSRKVGSKCVSLQRGTRCVISAIWGIRQIHQHTSQDSQWSCFTLQLHHVSKFSIGKLKSLRILHKI